MICRLHIRRSGKSRHRIAYVESTCVRGGSAGWFPTGGDGVVKVVVNLGSGPVAFSPRRVLGERVAAWMLGGRRSGWGFRGRGSSDCRVWRVGVGWVWPTTSRGCSGTGGGLRGVGRGWWGGGRVGEDRRGGGGGLLG